MKALCCLLLLCALPSLAQAATIYKYVNAQGVVSYTDKPVSGARIFQLRKPERRTAGPAGPAGSPADRLVRLETRRHAAGETLVVRNDLHAPVEVRLTLSGLDNVAGAPGKPLEWIVQPRSSMRLLSLSPRHSGQPWHYKTDFRYVLGDPRVQPKPYRYPLPWVGGPFRLTQGANGTFSHSTPKGRYARDIGMPEGTPILAARAGVVVRTENRQQGRGSNPSGNFVRVLHDDSTMSVYLHLQQGSVQVRPGQRVAAGTLLARSGNTGNSTGPHLHFVVQRNQGLRIESIPFEFAQPVNALPDFAMGGD